MAEAPSGLQGGAASASGRGAPLQTRLVENQPYDESLDVAEPEEVSSPTQAAGAPTRGPRRSPSPATAASPLAAAGPRAPPRGPQPPPQDDEDEERSAAHGRPKRAAPGPPPAAVAVAAPLVSQQRRFGEEDEDEDEDDDSSETDSEDDDDDDSEHGAPVEGAYNPLDYDCLPVSLEVKDVFQYIRRYSPHMMDLEHKLRPFIPDFIPAVGDIDAFLKVPRPDGKPDNLGLLVLDEPSMKQSDPTVLSLWLTENSKQHSLTQQVKVKSLENAEKNSKAIDTWIESISELHQCKPPASVHYARPMADIDTLMQEWSPEFEELLGKVSLPTADLSCSLAEYTDLICAILDIPVYKSRIQSLHVLFSLYSEFKNSEHFKALAEGMKVTSPPSNTASQAGDTDGLCFP